MNGEKRPFDCCTTMPVSRKQLQCFFDFNDENKPFFCGVRSTGDDVYRVYIQHYEEDLHYWQSVVLMVRGIK